ncbi:sulfate transporter CysZ [Ectothiorhodospiraceae bacterium WFHF3C12]|nr:sulfate transporter CysZ [Ectothiorhodospiraceae bacterium WFHF3C12]
MIGDLVTGAGYVPRGLGRLTEPGLRGYVWLPLLINVVVFIALFWLGGAAFQDLLDWMLPSAEAGADAGWWATVADWAVTALRWILWPLFAVAAALVAFYTFTITANLIGAPFNEFLARRVELLATDGRAPAETDEGGLAAQAIGSVADELRKLVYFAAVAIPLLVLFFVPVVQVAAPFLWAAFGAWAAALEYMDYPLGNHGIRFRDQRAQLRRRRMLIFGFGAGVVVMTLIPVVNLVAMPSAVIGATMLWVEQLGGRPASGASG